jgi:hypothetical protein
MSHNHNADRGMDRVTRKFADGTARLLHDILLFYRDSTGGRASKLKAPEYNAGYAVTFALTGEMPLPVFVRRGESIIAFAHNS